MKRIYSTSDLIECNYVAVAVYGYECPTQTEKTKRNSIRKDSSTGDVEKQRNKIWIIQ